MKIVGITGGMGSGKSTACRIFASLGVPVFNSDEEAKRLYDDRIFLAKVVKLFGRKILSRNGRADKKKLAQIVFADHAALKQLNALVHPEVRMRFKTWCRVHKRSAYVIKEAAIMIESGAWKDLDSLILIKSTKELVINRLKSQSKFDKKEVEKRWKEQLTDRERRAYADHVFLNDGTRSLIRQVVKFHQSIKRK